MSADQLVGRFRQFLLWLAIALCMGIVVELWLTGHTDEPLQLLPFALCGIGAAVCVLVLWVPNRNTIWLLRGVMLALLVGGLIGTYEHLGGNLAFAREVNLARANAAPIAAALTGGSPALAPGALAVTALIASAATYWHPRLGRP